jgi:hypothetical protein
MSEGSVIGVILGTIAIIMVVFWVGVGIGIF